MDVSIEKQPLPLGGIQWTRANRWVISTPNRIYVATPTSTTNHTQRQEATIELTDTTAVAVSVLEDSHGLRMVVLDNQSQVHLIEDAARRYALSMAADWQACTISATADQEEGAVVAVGSTTGQIKLVGVGNGELVERTEFLAHQCLVTHIHWAHSRLVTCGADGTACIWQVGGSIELEITVGVADWRPFTAVDGKEGCVVLARIGQAAIVNLAKKSIQYVELSQDRPAQTVVSCLYDPGHSRIYLGTYDCQLHQLSQRGTAGWQVDPVKLKEEVRKTIVRSFTTEFNMRQLVLRSLKLSSSGRYLVLVADDQINWEVAKDGEYVTRVHFHPLFPWSLGWCQQQLRQLVMGDGEWRGQKIWDLLDQCTREQVEAMVEYLRALEAPSELKDRRRLYMINYICCTATKSIESGKLRAAGAQARGRAMDLHVLELCQRLGQLDTDHVSRLQWTVSQLAYAEITDQLPAAFPPVSSDEARCPVCEQPMRLVSRLTACCDNQHVFDLCAVSLEILRKPGMAVKCDTCLAKRTKKIKMLSLDGLLSYCPICQGSFVPM